ncbi:Hsp20/alpha crystallin family protein [bacterium]|nr:Hsp20/alpha crystallin family protein [bacterium]
MKKSKDDVMKPQAAEVQDVERTSNRRVFVPQTDIRENEVGLVVVMDIPGALEKDVDINVKDNVLTIMARVEEEQYEGYRRIYSEYDRGDFQRSFRLSDEFDSDKIEASMSQGVLTLHLPKAEKKKPRRIEIKAG